MSRFGLDSTAPVPIDAHKAIGSTFAVRYLSRYEWKVLRLGEYHQLKEAGLDLALVFEDGADRARRGYDAGIADAQLCRDRARALGVDTWPFPCFWAVDYDTGGAITPLKDYARGFASIFGEAFSGPYGDFGVIEYFGPRGYLTWQTYAWSGGRFSEYAMLYQYSNGHTVGGIDVDFDKCFNDKVFIGASQQSTPKPDHKEIDANMIAAVAKPDGSMEIFVETPSGEVLHTWANEAGEWHGEKGVTAHKWESLGNPKKQVSN